MSSLNPLNDNELSDYRSFLKERRKRFEAEAARLGRGYGSLYAYADLHERLGLHRAVDPAGRSGWRMVEYLPQATRAWLVTNRTDFERRPEYELVDTGGGFWRLYLPKEALSHGDYYELHLEGTVFQSTIHQKCQSSQVLRLHRIWVYPTSVCCSCDQVAECMYLTLPTTSMRLELDMTGNISLVDQREERFIVSVGEPIMSFCAFVTENSMGSQIALVCRTKFFFQIYTDVFEYYKCLC